MSKKSKLWVTRAAVNILARTLENTLVARERRHATKIGLAPTANARQSQRVSMIAEPTSSAVTAGIRVSVKSIYLADQSAPARQRFVFAYTIVIENVDAPTAQLRTRHWIITNAHGEIEEVRGDGVVGEQPRLRAGQSFQYTSGCVLMTPVGTMRGTYRMWRDDGSFFDVEIAPFSLVAAQAGQSEMN